MATKKTAHKKTAPKRGTQPLANPDPWEGHGARVRESDDGRVEVDFTGRGNVVVFENAHLARRALRVALVLCGG